MDLSTKAYFRLPQPVAMLANQIRVSSWPFGKNKSGRLDLLICKFVLVAGHLEKIKVVDRSKIPIWSKNAKFGVFVKNINLLWEMSKLGHHFTMEKHQFTMEKCLELKSGQIRLLKK